MDKDTKLISEAYEQTKKISEERRDEIDFDAMGLGDDPEMDYGLYDKPGKEQVISLISSAIEQFVDRLNAIENGNPGYGMSDTASREEIAQAVGDAVFNGLGF